MTTQTINEGFEKLLQRMRGSFLQRICGSQIATAKDLHGCTPAEIEALERRYRIVFPTSYRRYLELMV